MGRHVFRAIALLLPLAGCASNGRSERSPGAMRPGDSARAAIDTAGGYRIRDTIPDTTVGGRRDTTTQR